MTESYKGTIAILYPGDREMRDNATSENNRLATVFAALKNVGLKVESAVYSDELCDEVREQLLKVDGVLVWRNPIQDGSDRSVLDPMLREVADAGVFVSAHPDVIMKIGTKEVLHATRDMGWGCDTHVYPTLDALQSELPLGLASGPRVLKQFRGNGGNGVWRVELVDAGADILPDTPVRVRHAKRGAVEEVMALKEFYAICVSYFSGEGRMIDQQFQDRIQDGMVRCYLTKDKVVGFGHQEINALVPAPEGADPAEAPQPGKRLYYPPEKAEFQYLKQQLESSWVAEMQAILDIAYGDLPMLWDCDFMFGPKDAQGHETYVLCEINSSSVAPYPDTAPAYIAQAVARTLEEKV